jgi:hypothetical protein
MYMIHKTGLAQLALAGFCTTPLVSGRTRTAYNMAPGTGVGFAAQDDEATLQGGNVRRFVTLVAIGNTGA